MTSIHTSAQNCNQKVFDYCMYMMLTSYFNSSVCKSKCLEKKLFLYYKEQKEKVQLTMEEQCIRLIEEEILPKIPARYLERSVDTHLRPRKDSDGIELLIHTGEYVLCVSTCYKAHNPKVTINQWVKKKKKAHPKRNHLGCAA